MKNYPVSVLTILLLSSTSVLADSPLQCTTGYVPVEINATLEITTSSGTSMPSGCPFLDNLKATEKFFPGSIYPGSPTCVSGTLVPSLDNTITYNGYTYNIIKGRSESAQRIFSEAEAINGSSGNPLFISSYDSVPPQRLFMAGAASTALRFSWELTVGNPTTKVSADFLVDDRFVTEVDLSNGAATDHEEFIAVATGPGGVFKDIKGRLRGNGAVDQLPSDGVPLIMDSFKVTGTICAKSQ